MAFAINISTGAILKGEVQGENFIVILDEFTGEANVFNIGEEVTLTQPPDDVEAGWVPTLTGHDIKADELLAEYRAEYSDLPEDREAIAADVEAQRQRSLARDIQRESETFVDMAKRTQDLLAKVCRGDW